MSFTLQTGVTLDVPPKVLDRGAEGSPVRAVAIGLGGQVWLQEMPQEQAKQRLVLEIAKMSDTQRGTIETALNTAGTRTVYTGVESVVCVPAPRPEQQFTALTGDYPDKDSGGSQVLPAWLRQWSARIVFYRVS
jgi:hypothetical protein